MSANPALHQKFQRRDKQKPAQHCELTEVFKTLHFWLFILPPKS